MYIIMYLDPAIWGPHYWFFLHTLAMTYPHHPNSVTKKKYYEFIQNFPLFIPVEQISKDFEKLLELFPINPYLDNRDSFVKWTHFIHNKINEKMEKPILSLDQFFIQYYNKYTDEREKQTQYEKLKSRVIYGSLLTVMIGTIIYLYKI
jgi:hypothetical protein